MTVQQCLFEWQDGGAAGTARYGARRNRHPDGHETLTELTASVIKTMTEQAANDPGERRKGGEAGALWRATAPPPERLSLLTAGIRFFTANDSSPPGQGGGRA